MVQPPFEIFVVPTWLRVPIWSGTFIYGVGQFLGKRTRDRGWVACAFSHVPISFARGFDTFQHMLTEVNMADMQAHGEILALDQQW